MDRQKDALYYTELLRTKKVSPEELIVDAFKKIDRENPRYNAVVHTRREKALHEARTRDFGNTLFGGVPILIKDLGQDLAGEPSTSGSQLLRNYVAPRTSHFIEAIEKAGFIVIGQTSTPEFGFKNITDAVIHGPTRNPFNRDHSPGGSSGGAAAPFPTPLFPGSHFQEQQSGKHRKFRIAYSLESPVKSVVSADAKQAVLQTVTVLEELGYEVEEKKPDIDGILLMEAYYAMNGAETDAMLRGFAAKLGRPLTADDMELVSWSLYQYGQTISGGDYSLALGLWDQAAATMDQFHESYDLLLQPTTAAGAPRIDHAFQSEELKERMRRADLLSAADRKEVVWTMFEESLGVTPFTQQANLTGQPAISLPVYRTDSGLPLGVQFTAPKGKEEWLLDIAAVLERAGMFI